MPTENSKSAKKSESKDGAAKAAAKSKVAKPAKTASAASGTGPKLKPSMHPNYRLITVEETDGNTFQVRSTYHNAILKLDIDKKTHPAWTKGINYVNVKSSEVAKFKNRFGDLSF